jgi:RNA polymerase sigma factor for flagellar operon FliA
MNKPDPKFKRPSGLRAAADPAAIGLWASYRASPSHANRNRLVEHYLPLVRGVAERIHSRLPKQVNLDDLISWGGFGLLDAVVQYQPARAGFSTFAVLKIRGKILDSLRSEDHASRAMRQHTRKLDAAAESLRQSLGRAATSQELADSMEVDARQFADREQVRLAVNVCSLSGPPAGADHRGCLASSTLEDTKTPDPARAADRRELREVLLRGLSRAERLVIILYYYEGMTLKEIGQTLDLSESRVSQMRSQILGNLRSQFSRGRTAQQPLGDHPMMQALAG